MPPVDLNPGGDPKDYAGFWAIWVVIVALTYLTLRRRRTAAVVPAATGAAPSAEPATKPMTRQERREAARVAAKQSAAAAATPATSPAPVTTPPAKTPLGRLVLGNLLVFASLFWTAVLAGETYLRYVYDATDSYGLTMTNCAWFRRHMKLNSDGYRDRDFGPAEPPGSAIVACIGDSFTSGYGVPDPADCWPQRLAALLAPGDRGQFDVRNYGDIGTQSGEQRDLLRRLARKGGARRAIIGYCLNDADDLAPAEARYQRGDSPPVPWIAQDTSYLADFLWFRLRLFDDPRIRGYCEWVGALYTDPDIVARQTVRFRETKDIADAAGIRLDVVIFPLFASWGERYPFDAVHDRVAEAWRSVGVEVFDLREAYRGIPGTELVVNRFDGHPNERAHDLAARAILDHLFVPRRDK